MKLCYNEACAMQQSTLAEDLILCEKAGFDYIEIRLDMLAAYLRTHTVGDLKEFFDTHHLKPHCINAIYLYEDFLSDRDDPAKTKALLEQFMYTVLIAREIGAPGMVVVSSFTDDGTKYNREWLLDHFSDREEFADILKKYNNFDTEAEIRSHAINNHVRMLRRLSELASPYGIKLALELVGMDKAAIGDIDAAREVVERVDRDNVGYAMDIANIYIKNNAASDFDKLKNVDARKIFAFHVNNADNANIKIQAERTLPDRGVLDAKKIISILKETGYDGMLSAETFRPEYFAWTPEKVITEAAKSIRAIMQ